MQLVPIARIGKPFGLQGGCQSIMLGEALQKLSLPSKVYIQKVNAADRELLLTALQTRPGKSDAVCFFETIKSIDEAHELTNTALCIEHERLPAIEDDRYYTVDLVGCSVSIEDRTEKFGTIAGIVNYPSIDVIEIFKTGGQRVQMPFLNELIVSIDTAAHTMVLKPAALDHFID